MWQALDITPPIDKQILSVTVSGVDIVVTQNNGNFYAFKDECPHEGIKLSLGCIKNNAIKCSLHGFSFDLETSTCDEAGVAPIITYPIKYENNTLWMQIN